MRTAHKISHIKFKILYNKGVLFCWPVFCFSGDSTYGLVNYRQVCDCVVNTNFSPVKNNFRQSLTWVPKLAGLNLGNF